MAEDYGISTVGAHRALTDCKMNQQVFEKMAVELLEKKNVDAGKEGDVRECPRCKLPMVKRNGRYGAFWDCSGFPNCRYTENA